MTHFGAYLKNSFEKKNGFRTFATRNPAASIRRSLTTKPQRKDDKDIQAGGCDMAEDNRLHAWMDRV